MKNSTILSLEHEETVLLDRILKDRIAMFRQEIRHADDRSFKEGLKREQLTLEGLVRRLEAEASVSVGA